MSGFSSWLKKKGILSYRLLGGRQATALLIPGIIIVAVALRVASALYQGDTIVALPGTYDQISYDTLAHSVLAGKGFTFPIDWWPATRAGEPTAHWSFIYTLYLSAVYAVVGQHPVVARLIQAIIVGVLQPWLTWRIGARAFGKPAGLIAAGIATLYSYFIYYAGALMTEAFYILAVLWMLDLATGMAQGPGAQDQARGSHRSFAWQTLKPWLLLGFAVSLAALLRQLILLFLPVLFVWLFWIIAWRWVKGGERDSRYWRSPIVGLLFTLAILFCMVVPWTVRNYQAFGRFVPLNTNSGFAFFWANHPIQGTNFTPILPNNIYQDLVPVELRGLDEAALDQALLKDGLNFVIKDPVRYALLSASRIPDYFEFWPSAESGGLSNLARLFSFGILLPFVIFGLFLSAARYRRHAPSGQSSTTVLLHLFIAVYSLIHLLSWALVRYRLPVDAVLILFAALALLALIERLANGPFRSMLKGGTQPKQEPQLM